MEERLKAEERKVKKQQNEMTSKVQDLEERNILSKQSPSREVELRSQPAKRQSLHRAKSAMPRKPCHFAGTLSDMVQKATPRKHKAISTVGMTLDKVKRSLNLEEAITEEVGKGLRKKSEKRKLLGSTLALLKKYKRQHQACRKFEISKNLLRNSNKTRQEKSAP